MKCAPLALYVLFCLTAPSFCQSCPPPTERYSAVIEISVDFAFQDSAYGQQWVFDSLQPELRETGSDKFSLYSFFGVDAFGMNAQTNFEITRDQIHHEVFCWAKKNVNEPFQTLDYTFASHKASFAPRPIEWESRTRDGNKGSKYSYGKMGTINYVYSGDLDWIILRNAQWLTDADGHPLLQLEIVNPRAKLDPGGEVHLSLSNTDSDSRCTSTGQRSEISVAFSAGSCIKPIQASTGNDVRTIGSCPIQVTTPDPGGTRPIRRKFDFRLGPCGEQDAQLDLGPTGVLDAGTVTNLQYVFEGSASAQPLKTSVDLSFLYSLKHRELRIDGTSIYPTRPKPMSLARE
jgi:hypothetical protein